MILPPKRLVLIANNELHHLKNSPNEGLFSMDASTIPRTIEHAITDTFATSMQTFRYVYTQLFTTYTSMESFVKVSNLGIHVHKQSW